MNVLYIVHYTEASVTWDFVVVNHCDLTVHNPLTYSPTSWSPQMGSLDTFWKNRRTCYYREVCRSKVKKLGRNWSSYSALSPASVTP